VERDSRTKSRYWPTVLSGDVGREGLRNAIEDAIEAGGFREVTVRDTEADSPARLSSAWMSLASAPGWAT
jgi:hypothetical protein